MQGQVTTKTVKAGKPQKDRLGSAVVSMILGIFSMFFFLLAILIAIATRNMYYSGGTDAIFGTDTIFALISGLLALVGFPLGVSARKSSKGRGMAIAGITLTVIPFLLMVLGIIMSIVYSF